MENKERFSISVVVPVYKSSKIINLLYERCAQQLNLLTDDWEIILVDDASPDDSWAVACSLQCRDPRVKVVLLTYNHGQQHATLCGIGYARKDYIITIDDDLQCFPEDIPLFIHMLNSGKHVVIGRIPRDHKQHKRWRNFGSRVNQWLAGKIIGKPEELSLSSFRAMSQQTAARLIAYKGAHPHIAALLFKSVPLALICNVDIRHAGRADGGSSSYSLSKLIKTISYLLINHSYLPLRFMIGWGTAISIASVSYALWILLRGVFSSNFVPGWASLAVLVAFLSGNILLALGIVGEYLGRLVEEESCITQFSVFEERI